MCFIGCWTLFLKSIFLSYALKETKPTKDEISLWWDKNKRKNKTVRLQVDNEFQQVRVKDLHDQNNVEIITTSVREGKAFAAEQKN